MKQVSVLLVEDDPDDVEIYQELFKSIGFPVKYSIARSSEEGLALLRAASIPDAIILDYNLPGMNGQQFARVLRSDVRFTQIPIAVISDVYQPEVDDDFRVLGIPCYTKPTSITVFQELLATALNEVIKA